MTPPTGPDWIWLGNGAIDEFKQWRIDAGATEASASSYSTGARLFVRYCRRVDLDPGEAVASFHDDLNERASDLSTHSRADYRSHARAFVRFLRERRSAKPTGTLARTAVLNPPEASPRREPPVPEPDWLASLSDASNADLLAGYARTLEVLTARQVLRTANAPVGDFAEWLVQRAFGGALEPNSTKSHDVTDTLGRKLQVKARLVSPEPKPSELQTSVFRSWAFDLAVLIQLAKRDYSVVRASMLPAHLFDEGRLNARWSAHVKGWAVFMTPALMNHPEAIDVTKQLRTAASET